MEPESEALISLARAMASAGKSSPTLGWSRRKGAATRERTWRGKVIGFWPSW